MCYGNATPLSAGRNQALGWTLAGETMITRDEGCGSHPWLGKWRMLTLQYDGWVSHELIEAAAQAVTFALFATLEAGYWGNQEAERCSTICSCIT